MSGNEQESRKGALGKGLASLLGEGNLPAYWQGAEKKSRDNQAQPTEEGMLGLLFLDPQLIDTNPEQPRKHFDEEEIKSLGKSIAQDGLLQPLVVMKSKHVNGRYILIAGERRLRASKLAGLEKVPVLVKETSLKDRLRLALIENIQRSDLNIIEEAKAYESLVKDYGLTQEQCAEKVGKDRSTIANTLRLLNLPASIHQDLIDQRLTMGHARALLSLEVEALILKARDIVLKKNLNVRKTELLCKNLKKEANTSDADEQEPSVNPNLEYIADNLRNHFRTKVRLLGAPQRGKIEISYFSTSELERILGLITKKL